jgi:hypothetical protein
VAYLDGTPATDSDVHDVERLIGRAPMGEFQVVVRDVNGGPVVLRNAPLLHDGTPMPTLYWLVGPSQVAAVGTLEASGAVDRVEAELGLEAIADIHRRYAAERDALIPPDHDGHRPNGGVGGTRRGVKCLHAHYAHHLAGRRDAVGEWVARQLEAQ